MNLKGIAVMAGAAVLTVALAGCDDYTTVSPDTTTEETTATTTTTFSEDPTAGALQPQKMYERPFTLKDGRTVTCLSTPAGGLSCNWPGAMAQVMEVPNAQ